MERKIDRIINGCYDIFANQQISLRVETRFGRRLLCRNDKWDLRERYSRRSFHSRIERPEITRILAVSHQREYSCPVIFHRIVVGSGCITENTRIRLFSIEDAYPFARFAPMNFVILINISPGSLFFRCYGECHGFP